LKHRSDFKSFYALHLSIYRSFVYSEQKYLKDSYGIKPGDNVIQMTGAPQGYSRKLDSPPKVKRDRLQSINKIE